MSESVNPQSMDNNNNDTHPHTDTKRRSCMHFESHQGKLPLFTVGAARWTTALRSFVRSLVRSVWSSGCCCSCTCLRRTEALVAVVNRFRLESWCVSLLFEVLTSAALLRCCCCWRCHSLPARTCSKNYSLNDPLLPLRAGCPWARYY